MPVDNLLFGATLALIVMGLWAVFDSSYVKTLDSSLTHNDALFFVKRQMVGVVFGLVSLTVMMRIGYWKLRKLAVPLMITALVLLLAVWIPHVGRVENHAARWIKMGPLQFQPSELAKIAVILYVSALLSRPHCNMKSFMDGIFPALLVTALALALIEREPDLGTAFVLFLAFMTILYLAGAEMHHLLAILAGAGLVVLMFGFVFGHRQGRITAFLHPDKDKEGIGYQIFHSRLAVGSGRVTGVGLGHGREKYYLPQGDSDFIFATVAEETGFAGSVVMLLLMGLVGWRGFDIAYKTRDRFGMLLAIGISSLISWQAITNVAVATASIPATGVPLPFISYGSTSLIVLLTGIGVLLNIAQNPVPPSEGRAIT
jgi:cell division protein FtsW